MVIRNMQYIVVIDDSRADLDLLLSDLRQNFTDYSVMGYTSEEELWNDSSVRPYDDIYLVIADAILGTVRTGWDILARFKREWPHVKRVLISNKVTTENMEDAINRCTPDGFIFKRGKLTGANIEMLRELLFGDRVTLPINDSQAQELISSLEQIAPGDRKTANLYKKIISELLSYIFYPNLRATRLEVPIKPGVGATVRSIDIVYYNAAKTGTLYDLKVAQNSLRLIVEVKNATELRASYFEEVESYLSSSISTCGFIVFRGSIMKSYLNQLKYLWSMGKAVFLFNDKELKELAYQRIRSRNRSTDFAEYLDRELQERYSNFGAKATNAS